MNRWKEALSSEDYEQRYRGGRVMRALKTAWLSIYLMCQSKETQLVEEFDLLCSLM